MSASGAVDLSVKEGIPHTGLYTSDQGAVSIGPMGEYELARIERAWLRVNNGVAVYRETGRRWGITYAGTPRVTGQITRAFLNMGLLKLILGVKPDTDTPIGPGVITADILTTILGDSLNSYPRDQDVGNFYPFRVNVALDVNKDSLPVTPATEEATTILDGGLQTLLAKNCILGTFALMFDSRGLVTSGPISFLGSAAQWSKI